MHRQCCDVGGLLPGLFGHTAYCLSWVYSACNELRMNTGPLYTNPLDLSWSISFLYWPGTLFIKGCQSKVSLTAWFQNSSDISSHTILQRFSHIHKVVAVCHRNNTDRHIMRFVYCFFRRYLKMHKFVRLHLLSLLSLHLTVLAHSNSSPCRPHASMKTRSSFEANAWKLDLCEDGSQKSRVHESLVSSAHRPAFILAIFG